MAGIGRVTTTVVEEIADVVSLENFDQTLILAATLFQSLELVAARAERTRWSVA